MLVSSAHNQMFFDAPYYKDYHSPLTSILTPVNYTEGGALSFTIPLYSHLNIPHDSNPIPFSEKWNRFIRGQSDYFTLVPFFKKITQRTLYLPLFIIISSTSILSFIYSYEKFRGWKDRMMLSSLLLTIFDERDQNTATLIKERSEPHLVAFHESISVSQWTFQITHI